MSLLTKAENPQDTNLTYHFDGPNNPPTRLAPAPRNTPPAVQPGEVPVGENVYRRIRSDLVFGRLAPGQKLTLDRMKESYGASVSTLREILNRLSSEGLIEAEGAKGFA